MSKENTALKFGHLLKRLIRDNYDSQEEFAYDSGYDIRTISRYVNNGINKTSTIEEIASIFDMDFFTFVKMALEEE